MASNTCPNKHSTTTSSGSFSKAVASTRRAWAGEALTHFRCAYRLEPSNTFVRGKLLELGDDSVRMMSVGAPEVGAMLADALRYPVKNRTGRSLTVAASGLIEADFSGDRPFGSFNTIV